MKAKVTVEQDAFPKPSSMEVMKLLSKEEQEKLAELEAVVDRHLKSFLEVVVALLTIKREALWRANYNSWEDYIETKWKMSRQHGHRLIQAGEIMEKVKNVTQGDSKPVPLPNNERAYREVGELVEKDVQPEELVTLFRAASKRTAGKRDIGPADIHWAAVNLKLVTKPRRVVVELKAQWQLIRDGLVEVIKALGKQKALEAQTDRLKALLGQVRVAVQQCPVPPKPKEAKAKQRAKGNRGAKPKPKRAK